MEAKPAPLVCGNEWQIDLEGRNGDGQKNETK